MRLFVLLVGVMLAGCQTTDSQGRVMRDQFGNLYPESCRQPVVCKSADDCQMGRARAWVQTIPAAELQKLNNDPLTTLHGRAGRAGVIMVSDAFTGAKREDLIKHELCHYIAGNWHS